MSREASAEPAPVGSPSLPEQSGASAHRRLRLLLAGVLLLASLALHTPGFFQPISFDETYRTFSGPFNDWWDWAWRDVHNPLYNIAMRGWITLFGDTEAVIRIPTVLFAHITALALGLWAGRRFGPWTGLTAAAVFLLNPAQVLHAVTAKNNAFTVMWGVLFVILLDTLRRDPRPRRVAHCTLAGILGVYTDWAFLYALLPASIMVAIDARRDGRAFRAFVVCIGGVLLSAIPLILLKSGNIETLHRFYLKHFTLEELWKLLATWLIWGNALLPRSFDAIESAAIGSAILLPLVIASAKPLWRHPSGRLVLALIVLPLAVTFVLSAIIHARHPEGDKYIFQPRNLLIIMPWYAVLLARGVTAIRPRAVGVVLGTLLVTSVATATTFFWTIHADSQTVYTPRNDFRAMLRAMHDDMQANPYPPGHGRDDAAEPLLALLVTHHRRPQVQYSVARLSGVEAIGVKPGNLAPARFDRLSSETGLTTLYFLDMHPAWLAEPGNREAIERTWRITRIRPDRILDLYRFDRLSP